MINLEKNSTPEGNYKHMVVLAKAIMEDEKEISANLSNISAIIMHYIKDINWSGFYRMVNGELVLGPFQGKPACVRIKVGAGVCGTCVAKKETIVVDNVHEFDGHIACDSNSNSEIVLPIFKGDEVFGVLDIDSPSLSRFGVAEVNALKELAEAISTMVSKPTSRW